MSESDGTPRRRPPTIDLTAEEIETGQQAAAQQSATEAANERAAPRDAAHGRVGGKPVQAAVPYLIGAAGGVIVAGAVAAVIWLAGLTPVREAAMTPAHDSAKTASNGEGSSRLEKIQEAPRALRPEEPRVSRLTEVEEKTKSLAEEFGALTHRFDDLAAASQTALEQAKAAAAAAASVKDAAENAKGAAQGAVQRADLEALTGRIAALEGTVQSLAANVAHHVSNADDRTARATVAAEALRAAVERGAPFEAELAAAKSLGADPDDVAVLKPFAAGGLTSAAALGRELSLLMPALQKLLGAESNDGSFLGRLEAHAQNLVRITPVDTPSASPGDASSSIARIAAAAANGDVTAALDDLAGLPEKVRTPAEEWIKKAKARETAIAASRRIAADALAALAKPAPQ